MKKIYLYINQPIQFVNINLHPSVKRGAVFILNLNKVGFLNRGTH
jgi:hypothetical protein